MLKKMKTVLSLVLVGIISFGVTFEVSAQRFPANYPIHRKTIKFQRGRTTAIVRGVARTPGIYEYHLRARAGQHMTVHLTSSNKASNFRSMIQATKTSTERSGSTIGKVRSRLQAITTSRS